MRGAGAGTSQRLEVTSVVPLHCLSLLASLASPPEKLERRRGEREEYVEEEGRGAEVGLSRHMMRVVRPGRAWESEKMEVTATIP